MSDVPPAYVPTQSVVVCEVCGSSTDVRWYCKNCQGSLCDTCREAHRETAISKKHSVVPRTGDVLRLHGPARIAEPCQKHSSKDISAYCNKCQVACCISCIAESHNGHHISTIEDAYLSAEKRLNDYIRELDKDVKGKLDEMAAQTTEKNDALDHHKQKAKDDVNAFRAEMKQEVDKSCDALINTIENPNTEHSSIMKSLESHRQKVDELITLCTERIREGKLDMIKFIPPQSTSLIPKVNVPPILVPSFLPNKKILNALKQEIGDIEYKQYVNNKADECFDAKMITIRKVSSFETKVNPLSITAVGNNDTAWIAGFDSDTMYLYDSDGRNLKSFTVKKGKGINGMVVKPSGEVIVSNDDKKVRCVKMNGTVSTMIDTEPFDVGGLCLTSKGEIVVCMRRQRDKNHVAVYSSDGRHKLKEIKQGIVGPLSVVQNGEDLCVVNCMPLSNVVCVDNQGDVKWVYEGKKGQLDRQFSPRVICRDKYYNLLVTDGDNHCVHYIDREGQLIQIILTEEQIGLVCHWGISVDDETGHVWVGCGGKKEVSVASYLKS